MPQTEHDGPITASLDDVAKTLANHVLVLLDNGRNILGPENASSFHCSCGKELGRWALNRSATEREWAEHVAHALVDALHPIYGLNSSARIYPQR